ncbi:MAG: arsenate reductase ArsC [Anaerolineales bacterium]|jgi:arsenate reductase
MHKIKVLFLCTGNSARSQMAEAFLRRLGRGRFEAFSAGLNPSTINPLTRRVMAEIGYNLDGQRSKSLDEYLGRESFAYLITVCDQAEKNCPFFPGGGARLHWSFEDPAAFEGTPEARLQKFREVRDLIEKRVRSWLRSQALPDPG